MQVRNQGAAKQQWFLIQPVEETAMQAVGSRIEARVWKELGQLAIEGMAVGLVFSMLLAAAVYMVAHNGPSADFALAPATAETALAFAPQ
jgi:hypothetical protein